MIIDQWTDEDGYAVLQLRGTVHTVQVFTTDHPSKGPHRHPILLEITGLSNAVAPLDQEDIDALHEFFGRFATKEKEKDDG